MPDLRCLPTLLTALPALLISGWLLTGCDSRTRDGSNESLIYCVEGLPESLNPQWATTSTTLDITSNQLYNRLLLLNPVTRKPEPELATAWQVSDDGLRYTFELRQQVAFHTTEWFVPGRALQAEDVHHSFTRLTDPTHPLHALTPWGYPFFSHTGFIGNIAAIEILDPHRIRFTLHQPQSDFLYQIASDFAVIHSAEYAQQMMARLPRQQWARIDQMPIGTGPFKLRHQQQGQWLRLERHGDYWRGPEPLRQLVFDYTLSASKRFAKMLSGECDLAPLISLRELHVFHQHQQLEVVRSPAANIAYLGLNTQFEPLDRPRVRQAIALALDPGALIEPVYDHTATAEPRAALFHLLEPRLAGLAGPELPQSRHDPAAARRLLVDAGLGDGFELTLYVSSHATLYNPEPATAAGIVRRQLETIGIRISIVKLPQLQLRALIKNGRHQLALTGWHADTISALHLFSGLLSCSSVPFGTNAAHWCHPPFEQQLQRARRAEQRPEQQQALLDAEQLIFQQLPLVPLATSERIMAKQVTIHGFELPAVGGLRFSGVYSD